MLAVVFANSFTSFYGGIAIFSVLGFMATQQGVEVGDVAEKGMLPWLRKASVNICTQELINIKCHSQ